VIGSVEILALALLGYALVSARLAPTPITAAMLFAGLGLLVGTDGLGLVEPATARTLTSVVLESALVLVLFTDAMGTRIRSWTRGASIASRLLTIGFVLTILSGAIVARFILPELPVWQALLLAAILAPTDAALGQAVVSDERVPVVIRNALNVESGLNDGLALPFVLVFLGLSLAASTGASDLAVIETFLRALVLSPVVGLLVGGIGGSLLVRAVRAGWSSPAWRPIGLLAIAALAYAAADAAGGSGFLATWVAGLVTGWVADGRLDDARALPEDLAGLLGGLSFVLFGAVLLGASLVDATVPTVAYALLSLTIVRIAPVAIALLGSRLALPSVAYLGWFGPRGLASIVFAGILVEEQLPGAATLVQVVGLTVGLSILLHGATAAWGARRYGAWFTRASIMRPDLPEAEAVAPVHGRVSARALGVRAGSVPPSTPGR
jgi:NhaP-type Na+/H+ or K+/H+ antiporter